MKRAHFVFLKKLDFRVGFKSQMMFVTKMRLLLSKACSLFCFLFHFQLNIFFIFEELMMFNCRFSIKVTTCAFLLQEHDIKF